MKKIKSLIELDFAPLSSTEAISTKGGGEWVYMDGQWSYMLDEVTVTGEKPAFDPARDTPALQDPDFRDWANDNPVIGSVMEYFAIGVSYLNYMTR